MSKLLSLLLTFTFFLLPFHASAIEEEAAPFVDPREVMVKKDFALVRVLDKTSGRTRQLRLPVGQTSNFEKLDITVKTCLAAPEFQPEDYSAFFQINKTGNDNRESRVFSGWMLQSSPGANPLEDENYDLWLVKCI